MLTYDLNENQIGFYSKRVVKFENLLNTLLVFYYFVDGESSSSSTTTAAAAAPIAAKPISTISIKRKADADAASPVKVGSFFRVVFSPTVPIGVF